MRVKPHRIEGIHPSEKNPRHNDIAVNALAATQRNASQLIDWFAEGQTFAVEVAGIAVTVRFVCRNGRRARIAITAPAGAVFRALDTRDAVL